MTQLHGDERAVAPTASGGDTRAYVLLVDDRPENLYALEAVLLELHAELVSARSGLEALERVSERNFSVILLDVQMPGLDGIETARLIREREGSPPTPIIFLTAGELGAAEGVRQAYALGAVDYLVKPIEPEVIRAKVGAFVELARARGRLERAAAEHRELEAARAEAQALATEKAAAELAAERTRVLFAVSAALADAITLKDVAQIACAEMIESVGAAAAAVVLARNGGAEMLGSIGYEPEVVASWRSVPADAALPTMDVLRAGQPLWIDTLDELARRYPSLDARHTLARRPANAILPLFLEGQPRGALALGFARERPFDGAVRDLLAALASQCAAALERAWLYEDAQLARESAEAATRRAEEADRTKSDFLATMSHELRTPINAIVGYTDLLDLAIAGPVTEAQRQQLGRIRDSARHLLGLVNEILDLSRIESGRMQVARDAVEGADAADAALALIRPQAAAKHITISERCLGHRAAHYIGDEVRVRQILLNLLSNAVKFTDAGGSVTIECDASDEVLSPALGAGPWTRFVVSDSGIGVPREKQASIFEPFVQGETGSTRTRSGTGLGLAISRRLARLMGGELTVDSEPGRGSRFILWLPASVGSLVRAEDSGQSAAAQATGDHAQEDRLSVAGLQHIGTLLLEELGTIVACYREHLRHDSATPTARELDDLRLEDHVATFLTDIAQTLSVMGTRGDASQLMHDGTEIQRLISERHGAQRHRIGWSEAELVREFEVLQDEIGDALSRRLGSGAATYETELSVLRRFIEQAARISTRGFRAAAATSDS